jgi:hypothetical protein
VSAALSCCSATPRAILPGSDAPVLRQGKNLIRRAYFARPSHAPARIGWPDRSLHGWNGDIYLPITRMPLAEVREAHRRIEAQETVGKVILQP